MAITPSSIRRRQMNGWIDVETDFTVELPIHVHGEIGVSNERDRLMQSAHAS